MGNANAGAGNAEVALLEISHGGEIEITHIVIGQVWVGAEMLADVLLIERGGQAKAVLDRLDALADDLDDIVLRALFAILGGTQLKPGHVALVALLIFPAQVVEVEVDVEAGAVFRQRNAIAVADDAARRGQELA